ncbi:hypothetical protein L1887_15003 [Cichorium endivia]|nr:hypothetical protein L1887_15003 [Cichorium endivia]
MVLGLRSPLGSSLAFAAGLHIVGSTAVLDIYLWKLDDAFIHTESSGTYLSQGVESLSGFDRFFVFKLFISLSVVFEMSGSSRLVLAVYFDCGDAINVPSEKARELLDEALQSNQLSNPILELPISSCF